MVGVALAALLALQTHKTHGVEAQLATANSSLVAAQKTIINYHQAAEKARQADAQNVARVRTEQAVINQRTINSYEARLADARARASRLRQDPRPAAHPGSSGTAGMPGTNAPSGGADGSAPAPGLSDDERLVATEQAIQLDELIKWIKANLTVNYSGSSPSLQSPTGNR